MACRAPSKWSLRRRRDGEHDGQLKIKGTGAERLEEDNLGLGSGFAPSLSLSQICSTLGWGRLDNDAGTSVEKTYSDGYGVLATALEAKLKDWQGKSLNARHVHDTDSARPSSTGSSPSPSREAELIDESACETPQSRFRGVALTAEEGSADPELNPVSEDGELFYDCPDADALSSVDVVNLETSALMRSIQEAREAYESGCPLTAHRLLEQCCEAEGVSWKRLEDVAGPSHPPLAAVLHDARTLQAVLDDIKDDTTWTVSRNDELRVLYRHTKGTTVHSIKFEGVLEAPLLHCLAVAREFDMHRHWNRFVTDSCTLACPSLWDQLCYISGWAPYPLPQFDLLMRSRAFDLGQEDRSLLILLRDPTAEEAACIPGGALPPAAAKRSRASMLPGSAIRLEALPVGADGVHRTRGTIISHLDPHLPFVPSFLVTFVLKVLSPYAWRAMQKVMSDWFDPALITDGGNHMSKDRGQRGVPHAGTHLRRIAEQPELYAAVQQRVERYMHHHFGQGQTL